MSKEGRQKHEPSEDDKKQFLSLLEPVLPKLGRFALALTREREEARDLVSESIQLAFEHFHNVREPQAFISYLFTIARRLYYNQRKRRAIWLPWSKEADERSHDPGPGIDAKLDCEALDRALLLIPEKQREAVILFEISELSLEEVRKIQGGALSGVKSRIARGRAQLAAILGDSEIQSGTGHRETTGEPKPTHAPMAYIIAERL